MTKECSKAVARRLSDSRFVSRYFVGDGVDIGGAPDPLSLHSSSFPLMGKVKLYNAYIKLDNL